MALTVCGRSRCVVIILPLGALIIRCSRGDVTTLCIIRSCGYPTTGPRTTDSLIIDISLRGIITDPSLLFIITGRIITTQRERPQTVRVIRSNGYAPSVRRIPEGRMVYAMDDSYVPGRYATRRILVRNGDTDNDYDNNIHRLYKTTINVSSSESDSSDNPKEVHVAMLPLSV
jgi:hypothetical protein